MPKKLSAGRLLNFVIFFTFIFFPAVSVSANEKQDRNKIIEKKLNCVAQSLKNNTKDTQWADICSTDVPAPEGTEREKIIAHDLQAVSNRLHPKEQESISESLPQNNAPSALVGESVEESPPEMQKYLNPDQVSINRKHELMNGVYENKDRREHLKKTELAVQYSASHYKADATWPLNYYYSAGNAPEKDGKLWGAYLSYSYHRPYSAPVHTWRDLKRETGGPGPFFTFLRFEADVSWADITYKSVASGKVNGIDGWRGNVRLLGGYDFLSQDESFMVTPYIGLGYRRVEDKAGGWEGFQSMQYQRYEFISDYFYIPLGLETLKHVNEYWDFGFKAEGSVVFYGTDDFGQSDIQGSFTDTIYGTNKTVVVHLKDTTSNLNGGFGFRSSIKMIRKFERFNIFTEPYFELWRIPESKKSVSTAVGPDGTKYYSVNLSDGSPYKSVFEASNYTIEYGLRIGVQF